MIEFKPDKEILEIANQELEECKDLSISELHERMNKYQDTIKELRVKYQVCNVKIVKEIEKIRKEQDKEIN